MNAVVSNEYRCPLFGSGSPEKSSRFNLFLVSPGITDEMIIIKKNAPEGFSGEEKKNKQTHE